MTLGLAVSKRINALLFERDWSVYKLCREACLPLSTIVNLYNGHTKSPTLLLVFKVAEVFGMTILEFLDDPLFCPDNLDLD